MQLQDTESTIRNKLIDLLSELRAFKFVITLVVDFQKTESDDATKYTTVYSNFKVETITNESKIDDLFESVYNAILSNIRECLGKTLAWIIDSAVSYSINISQHNPLSDSNYIKLPKELEHPKKGLLIF